MKLSIKSVFKNIIILLALLTFLLAIISFVEFQQYKMHERFDDLLKIQSTVYKLSSLKRTNIAYSKILLKSYSDTMLNQIKELQQSSSRSYLLGIFEYNQNKMQHATSKFETLASLYQNNIQKYLMSSNKQERYNLLKIQSAKIDIMLQIEKVEQLFIQNSYMFTNKFQWIIYLTLLIAIFTLFFYKKRFQVIYLDIETLYGINTSSASNVHTLTQEVDAIRLRMARKPTASDNPSMIDPATQIKNYKGMIYSYANKKGTKKNFTAVCLFEINNFAQKNNFSKEFVNNVLKKIASILSLYEQATDVVARNDFNQFVFILSRDTKTKMFQECEAIRQSVEESIFKQVQEDKILFTLSGGFVIKPRHKSLDDTLKDALKLLLVAKNRGGNQIIQLKDYAENF